MRLINALAVPDSEAQRLLALAQMERAAQTVDQHLREDVRQLLWAIRAASSKLSPNAVTRLQLTLKEAQMKN